MAQRVSAEINTLQQQFSIDDYVNCITKNKGIFMGQVRWCSKLFTGEWKTHFLQITDKGSLIHSVNKNDMARINSLSSMDPLSIDQPLSPANIASDTTRHAIIKNLQGSTINLLKSRNIVPIIHIETCAPESNQYYLKVSSTSKFKELLIVLTWWSSMKTEGIFNKLSLFKYHNKIRSKKKSSSNTNVCQLNVYGPIPANKNIYSADGSNPTVQDDTDDIDSSSMDFIGSRKGQEWGWFPAMGVIGLNGTIELLSQIDGSLIYSINTTSLLRSEIISVDKTLLPNSFCILLSENLPLRKRFNITSHFRISQPHSNNNLISNEILLRFPLKIDMDHWLLTLNSFAMKEKLSLNGINKSNQLRISNSLKLNILEANLESITLESSGNFGLQIELLLNGQIIAHSSTIYDTNKPFWREEFEINQSIPIYDLRIRLLHKVVSQTGVRKSNVLSEIQLDQDILNTDKFSKESWVPITDIKNINFQLGSICLKVFNNLQLVLSDGNFSKFDSLLMRCPMEQLVVLVNDKLKEQMSLLEPISCITLNIFQYYNKELEWFQNLIHFAMKKVDNSIAISNNNDQGYNSIFRGNSIFTISVEKYFNRIGEEYLFTSVGKIIRELINDPSIISFEIDPQRIRLNDENKAKEQIETNEKHLLHWLNRIWDTIKMTSNDLPSEIKQILKMIRQHLEMNCLDKDRLQEVTLYCVSSILFLRFFCPIILNPQLFKLVDGHCSEMMRRNLTIMSKILLSFSILNPFGLKETWLTSMNDKFIDQHRNELIDYVGRVTEKKLDFTSRKIKLSNQRKGKLYTDKNPFLIDIKCNEMELIKIISGSDHLNTFNEADRVDIGELEFENINEDNTDIFGNEFKLQLQINDNSNSDDSDLLKSSSEEIKQESMLLSYKLNHLVTIFQGFEYPSDTLIYDEEYVKKFCHSIYLNEINRNKTDNNGTESEFEIIIDINGIKGFNNKLFNRLGIFNYNELCVLNDEERLNFNGVSIPPRKGSLKKAKSDGSNITNTSRRRFSRITSRIIGRDDDNDTENNKNNNNNGNNVSSSNGNSTSSGGGISRWFSVKR